MMRNEQRKRLGFLLLSTFLFTTTAWAIPQDVDDLGERKVPEESAQPADQEPSASDAPRGMGPYATGCIQIGTGCGVGLLAAPLNIASCGLYGCLVHPAVAAYAQTWAGDYFGQKRGAALYPILASYAFGIASTAVSIALPFVFPVTPSTSTDSTQQLLDQYSQPNLWITYGTSLAFLAVGVSLVPVIYNLTADDKHPGDTGSGLPGIMKPAHPNVSAAVSPPPPAESDMAMAW